MRLTTVRINGAHIIGYSACLYGSGILTLQSHTTDESLPLSFYKDVDRPGAVWIYMPVAQDERIAEIRLRRGKESISSGLMVGTYSRLCHEGHFIDNLSLM
jgi:hypothetical protein